MRGVFAASVLGYAVRGPLFAFQADINIPWYLETMVALDVCINILMRLSITDHHLPFLSNIVLSHLITVLLLSHTP